jgi:hypothetical protein
VFPARISIGQAVVAPSVRLTANNAACLSAGIHYEVDTTLVHGADSTFYDWSETSPTDAETLYAWQIAPGTYSTVGGHAFAYDSDFNEISTALTRTTTVVKFTGRAGMSLSRAGQRVTIRASAVHWTASDRWTSAPGTVVDFQRWLNGTPGIAAHWQTFQRVRTNSAGAASFTYTKAIRMRYRIVTEDTASTFGYATATQIQ